MTPIERAARALHHRHQQTFFVSDPTGKSRGDWRPNKLTAWDDLNEGQRNVFYEDARTVIEQIREPSDAAIEAGSSEFRGIGVETRDAVKEAWHAMINVALGVR